MAGLKFTFEADVQKILQTRKEIDKLKKAIEKCPLILHNLKRCRSSLRN